MSDSSVAYIEDRKRKLAKDSVKCPHCGTIMSVWESECNPCSGCVAIFQREEAFREARKQIDNEIRRSFWRLG